MMRRRALLAASQTGGGAPEFPLYLYFDYCEDMIWIKYCERAADDLSLALYAYLKNVTETYGEEILAGYEISEDVINMLGIVIYVENELVYSISVEYNAVFLITRGEYQYTGIRKDGLISYEG